jgi:hypothetical protein
MPEQVKNSANKAIKLNACLTAAQCQPKKGTRAVAVGL